MTEKYYTYADIPKGKRKNMKKRIESTIKVYGFEIFRKCTLKYIADFNEKSKLQNEILEKEKELKELKNKK